MYSDLPSTETLADHQIAASMAAALDQPDLLSELRGLAEVDAQVLLNDIAERLGALELDWNDVASLMGVPRLTVERWRQQPEVARARLAGMRVLLSHRSSPGQGSCS